LVEKDALDLDENILSISEKKYYDTGDLYYEKRTTFLNNFVNEYITTINNFESNIKYECDYFEYDLYLTGDCDVRNPSYVLRCQDEGVSFRKINNKLVPWTTSLKFSFDPFFYFPFILNEFHGGIVNINER
jgi:hypothetical protein